MASLCLKSKSSNPSRNPKYPACNGVIIWLFVLCIHDDVLLTLFKFLVSQGCRTDYPNIQMLAMLKGKADFSAMWKAGLVSSGMVTNTSSDIRFKRQISFAKTGAELQIKGLFLICHSTLKKLIFVICQNEVTKFAQ